MPDELTCFACEQEPTQQCPRCGRPYCYDHGEDVCDACLEPASGLPSFTLYRGSLLALLVGTALAVWLILQPPGQETAAFVPGVVTSTPPAAAQTPAAGRTPAAQQTPAAGQTPAAAATPTARPAGTSTYTVQSGDSLSGICGAVAPAGLSNSECVDRIVELNSLSNPNDITVGQELTVPQ